MHTPEIEEDHPINMKEDSLLNNPEILPQMRFLLNNKVMLDLTIKILLAGIKIIN